MEEIEKNHENSLKVLSELRRVEGNSVCADCGRLGTVWSSVNIGIFLCLRCGSLHRAIGTHISKPKGCTGTYLWGPDEIARMKEVGNVRSNATYGCMEDRPSNEASDSEWLAYIKKKYHEKRNTLYVDKQKNDSKKCAEDQSGTARVPVADLLRKDDKSQTSHQIDKKKNMSGDFFASFGV